jgi:hypothetical protein
MKDKNKNGQNISEPTEAQALQKALTADEMHRLEVANLEEHVRVLTEKDFERQLMILDLRKQLLTQQSMLLDRDMGMLQLKRNERLRAHAQQRTEHQQYTKSIQEKYDLKERFGYDPDTGVITVDSEIVTTEEKEDTENG